MTCGGETKLLSFFLPSVSSPNIYTTRFMPVRKAFLHFLCLKKDH